MSKLTLAIDELDAHIQLLWEYVAQGHYDSRSIVGDHCLSLHERMRDRIKGMLPKYETGESLAGQLAFLLPSMRAIRGVVDRQLYNCDKGQRLEDWIFEAERIFSGVKLCLTPGQLQLLEKAEQRQNRAEG